MTHWKTLTNAEYIGAFSIENGTDLILTISGIKKEMVTGSGGRKEECIVCSFSDANKPMILNKTNCKTIQKIYNTPLIEEWIGKKIQLFATKTSLAGEQVECLRIRAFTPKAAETIILCTDCKKPIIAGFGKTAQGVADYTLTKYGVVLCADCATIRKAAVKGEVE